MIKHKDLTEHEMENCSLVTDEFLKALLEQNKIMREALEWYANVDPEKISEYYKAGLYRCAKTALEKCSPIKTNNETKLECPYGSSQKNI